MAHTKSSQMQRHPGPCHHLRSGDIRPLLKLRRLAVMHQDIHPFGTGCLEAPVALMELTNLPVIESIVEAMLKYIFTLRELLSKEQYKSLIHELFGVED